MKHRTLCTWFACLVCLSVVFANNLHYSSTPVASEWSINKLLNRGNENSRTEDADFGTQHDVQREGSAPSISPRSRTTSDKARGPQGGATATPISPRSRDFSDGAGRQRINNSQNGPPFDSRREENEMMDPGMFMNPWALWGMRWANAWQRSTRSTPWNMWYRMNPMLSFWNQFSRDLANGNGYGYGEQYPNEYSRISDGRYRPGRYASYSGQESQETYQQPAESSYYRTQSPESSSRPYNRGQRTPQPAQPYYRNQREEEIAQPPVSGTSRVSQNYRQQSTPASESYVRPPRSNTAAAREYREPPTNAKESDTSVPFTLLYYDDPPSNSNAQSPTSSEFRNQRTESNGQRERNEND